MPKRDTKSSRLDPLPLLGRLLESNVQTCWNIDLIIASCLNLLMIMKENGANEERFIVIASKHTPSNDFYNLLLLPEG